MLTPHSILKKYWNYDQFRPQQEEIIQHILSLNDTLAILPTGGGKSICYQVPALSMEGCCLVISPLIALMNDQARSLQERGIKTLVVHSGMNREEVRMEYEKMESGEFQFLFISPERLKSVLFLDYLRTWNISLIAVDEAHCISQWGYDFRPSYLEIALIREHLPQVPVIALTASATPFVQKDIIEKLAFKKYKTYFTTFSRPNLSFSCFQVENKIVKTIDILQKVKGSSLVYCRNRRRTKEIAETLVAAGLSADFFHAGLDQEDRNKKQANWLKNNTTIMVCTNAFGMGIDKPDVQCVIHYDIPDTPEGFYQEAGRAGRDGNRSYAVLLFQQKDLKDLIEGIELKYPDIETIKDIYEALAYYFQVALFQGEESIHDFDVADFSKKFDFRLIQVLSSIKLLEQQGYWALSESIFLPSRISITCSKEDIENLEQHHPELDEILKHVLRLYGGIWHHFIPVRELQIAQQARVSIDYVQMVLRKLDALGIIQYIEAKDKPQLCYLHDRVPKDLLNLDIALINTLKLRYTERVSFMIDFATDKTECRAIKLIGYFKETLVTLCKICDFCIAEKQTLKGREDFNLIKSNILQEIELYQSINISNFCQKYSTLKQEIVMKTIRFLLDDQQIELNRNGELIKKK